MWINRNDLLGQHLQEGLDSPLLPVYCSFTLAQCLIPSFLRPWQISWALMDWASCCAVGFLDFQSNRTQMVRIKTRTSFSVTANTGAPRGCVLSPLLTHDRVTINQSNHIIKYVDVNTVVGLITNYDESAHRDEVRQFESLWMSTRKEMIVDFRRAEETHSPLQVDGKTVEIVHSVKFLGVHITDKPSWNPLTPQKGVKENPVASWITPLTPLKVYLTCCLLEEDWVKSRTTAVKNRIFFTDCSSHLTAGVQFRTP